MRIELGKKVRDKITGFHGVVTGRVEYLTGCEQVLIQPPTKQDGAWVDSHWLDIDRVEAVESVPVTLPVTKAGPDKAAPQK